MINIREASSHDNCNLLRLTSLTPMQGQISIRTDRNPDFFNLLDKRGPSKVFIAEENGNIIGCFSASQSEMIVNAKQEVVYYLADLKIDPLYEGKTVTVRLLRRMAGHLIEDGADILFCTAAFGNDKIKPLFAGRAGFPKFDYTGVFKVYQIIPFVRKIKSSEYLISETEVDDEIIDLYERFYERYQYRPVYRRQFNDESRTIAALQNKVLKASITLINTEASKQNVLIALPPVLKLVLSVLKAINRFSHFLNLPEVDKPVRILYVKAFAFVEGGENAFDSLIRRAINLACSERFHYLAVGIHERDNSAKYFTKYLHFTFNSEGFILSMKGDKEKIQKILTGVLFEDYSLV